MVVFVGLGNPGKKYRYTRHNLGFRVLDLFRRKNNFPKFKLSKKPKSLVSESSLYGKKVILIKPQAFMNSSGTAVASLKSYYKIKSKGIIVIHDDVDIRLGKIKIIKDKGAAGHKGVQSIIDKLNTKSFARIRVGIRPVDNFSLSGEKLEKFVLKKFTREEKKAIKKSLQQCTEAMQHLLKNGLEKTMNKFN